MRVVNIPKALSPSSLLESMTQPNTFFLKRLCEDRIPKEEQNKAAAYGSAFDVLVKHHLNKTKKIPMYTNSLLEEDLEKSVEVNRKESIRVGKRILKKYLTVENEDWVILDVKKRFFWGGVPIYGILDAVVDYEDNQIPFDWKCSGLNSQASPKPGYFFKYNTNKMKLMPKHKKYYDGIRFEEIDKKWAIQTATYGAALGLKPPFKVRIDLITKTGSNNIFISKYVGVINDRFFDYVKNLYYDLWNRIINGTYTKDLCTNIDGILSAMSTESWF